MSPTIAELELVLNLLTKQLASINALRALLEDNAGEGGRAQGDELQEEYAGATIREERKIHLYSSKQRILLVGEGDFSFSKALATAFGADCANMVATSLDTRDQLLSNYGPRCETTLQYLQSAGVELLHGVDATLMAQYDYRFINRRFDRIVYNFPHAGFTVGLHETSPARIRAHKQLLCGFFRNARRFLAEGGEVHVTHHVGRRPYSDWKLQGAAEKVGLVCTRCEPFHKSTFPGYVNRKGQGPYCRDTFSLGVLTATYIFTAPQYVLE